MSLCHLFITSWLLGCSPDTSELTEASMNIDSYQEAVAPCDVEYPPHVAHESGYRTYRTYEVYQLALFQELCVSWYVMQQPKNHGIWLSRGAPNF